MTNTNETLRQLTAILERRKGAKPDTSYVASLYVAGLDKILDKIDEEAKETIAAARTDDTQHLIHEIADLWFHCMVLLAHKNTSHEAVLAELNERLGTSGHVEKAQRRTING